MTFKVKTGIKVNTIDVVNSAGYWTGSTIQNNKTTAASANGASTIVARDTGGSATFNIVSATSFNGDGSSLTALNASNVTSGTLANARTTAASANGASTIVARDTGGSAWFNIVTASAFSGPVNGDGSGLSALNASNVTSGTLANARTTAASANGASTIVSRDTGGSFTGNIITATTFSGSGASLTNIPNSATTASSSNGASTIVARDTGGSATFNVVSATTFSGAHIGDGSGLSALNASNVTSGTLANARTTAASSNGASTIVARDTGGSANFNVVTATTFSGSGASLTNIPNSATTASSSNGASTIVARDTGGSANFNVVTATTLSGTHTGDGSSLTSLNASQLTSGTVSNARTTATSANTASTIVSRDNSGGFSANNVTVVDLTATGNTIIQGNLTVNGTTTTVNSNVVDIGDSQILLNSDETGVPTQDAGIEIERGSSTNVKLIWNETSDRWTFTNNGTNYFNIPVSTEYNNTTYSISSTSPASGNGANLTISGTDSTTDSVRFVGAGTVTVTRTDADTITITGAGSTENTTPNITSSSAVIVDSFSTATYRTVEYTYHVKTTTGTPYFSTGKINLVHDDSNVYMTEYAMVSTNPSDDLATFTSNISTGTLRLLAQATSANVTVKIVGAVYSTV